MFSYLIVIAEFVLSTTSKLSEQLNYVKSLIQFTLLAQMHAISLHGPNVVIYFNWIISNRSQSTNTGANCQNMRMSSSSTKYILGLLKIARDFR